jgi:hypothetical protein
VKHFATALLAFGIMLAGISAARADTTCPPNPPPGSTVNGNLVVPPGTVCQLFGVTVTGNVQVQTNAHLNISDNATQGSTIDGNLRAGTGAILDVFVSSGFTSTIDGNIVADQCSAVELVPAIVGGNVSIQNCTGGQFVGYSDAEIAGNFTCNDNSIECDALAGNVKGNVQINNNAVAEVFVNTIGGNLQCQGNTTIIGSGNTVGGHEQGQCAGF